MSSSDHPKKKVFVGMSGGVDSSVSAALLQKAGYDVTGVFIKVWQPDWLPCSWKEERRDAMRVAAHLGIPFLTFDFQAEYKKEVADYMIDAYRRGLTPNPDVMCNKEIKFGSFLNKALSMGADFVATGHYAKVKAEASSGPVRLYEGNDQNKDQSYFLWTLTQKELSHILFPVGHLEKSEVRNLAKKFGLPTAEKKDSQGICFIGDVEMREFLSHYIPEKQGNVLNEKGEIIGSHTGAVFYTLGERHGFVISKKTSTDTPYYIISKDIAANTLTVSQKASEDSLSIVESATLTDVNWISGIVSPHSSVPQHLEARFRYRQEKQACRISGSTVIFTEPQQAVSAGQSLVLYKGTELIGGGIIAEER